jgi:hypothetical protein
MDSHGATEPTEIKTINYAESIFKIIYVKGKPL